MSNELTEFLNNMPVFEYRLTDGSFIVALQLNATLTYHQIAYPLEITPTNDNTAITLEEWLPYSSDKKHYLNCSNVIAWTRADLQLTKFYHQHLLKITLASDIRALLNGSAQSLSNFLHLLDPTEKE